MKRLVPCCWPSNMMPCHLSQLTIGFGGQMLWVTRKTVKGGKRHSGKKVSKLSVQIYRDGVVMKMLGASCERARPLTVTSSSEIRWVYVPKKKSEKKATSQKPRDRRRPRLNIIKTYIETHRCKSLIIPEFGSSTFNIVLCSDGW